MNATDLVERRVRSKRPQDGQDRFSTQSKGKIALINKTPDGFPLSVSGFPLVGRLLCAPAVDVPSAGAFLPQRIILTDFILVSRRIFPSPKDEIPPYFPFSKTDASRTLFQKSDIGRSCLNDSNRAESLVLSSGATSFRAQCGRKGLARGAAASIATMRACLGWQPCPFLPFPTIRTGARASQADLAIHFRRKGCASLTRLRE